jgi:hypothetical protein
MLTIMALQHATHAEVPTNCTGTPYCWPLTALRARPPVNFVTRAMYTKRTWDELSSAGKP